MINQNTLVSVIIPIYNAAEFINDCIQSVLDQSYKNLEIILVNDGSSDNSFELISHFNDDRIIIINQLNQGCSSAKNAGLRISKGDFIQYLDADDILSGDKIYEQVELLMNKEMCVAVCKTIIFHDDLLYATQELNTSMLTRNLNGIDFLLNLLGRNGEFGMVQPNAYLIPRAISNLIGLWDQEISPSPDEDGEYFARVLLCTKFVIFSKGINFYRKLPNQQSLSQKHSLERALNLLRTVDIKFRNIFNLDNSNETKELYLMNVSQVAYQYGLEYPIIVDEAKKLLKNHNFYKLKILSPWKFKLISRFIGFDITLKLKRLIIIINRQATSIKCTNTHD